MGKGVPAFLVEFSGLREPAGDCLLRECLSWFKGETSEPESLDFFVGKSKNHCHELNWRELEGIVVMSVMTIWSVDR